MIVWIAEGPLAALHEPRSIASYQSLDGRHAVVVFFELVVRNNDGVVHDDAEHNNE